MLLNTKGNIFAGSTHEVYSQEGIASKWGGVFTELTTLLSAQKGRLPRLIPDAAQANAFLKATSVWVAQTDMKRCQKKAHRKYPGISLKFPGSLLFFSQVWQKHLNSIPHKQESTSSEKVDRCCLDMHGSGQFWPIRGAGPSSSVKLSANTTKAFSFVHPQH